MPLHDIDEATPVTMLDNSGNPNSYPDYLGLESFAMHDEGSAWQSHLCQPAPKTEIEQRRRLTSRRHSVCAHTKSVSIFSSGAWERIDEMIGRVGRVSDF